MDALKNLAKKVISLDINRILMNIYARDDVKEFIINLNTNEQLFKFGIDSKGISLETIGGGYSPVTIEIKKEKGQPTDRITLKDTEDFYKTFEVDEFKTYFEITADPVKDDSNLFDDWGDDIVGLTEESLEKLRKFLVPLIQEQILLELS